MKGPSERLKYDFRRIWECPVCQRREFTSGDVAHRLCRCQSQVPPVTARCMRLVGDGARRLTPPIVLIVPAEPPESPAGPAMAGDAMPPGAPPPADVARGDIGPREQIAQAEEREASDDAAALAAQDIPPERPHPGNRT